MYSAFRPYYNHSVIFMNSVNFFCYCLEISRSIWCDIGHYWSNGRMLKWLNLTTSTSSDDVLCSTAITKQWQSAIEIRPNTHFETFVLQVWCCLL